MVRAGCRVFVASSRWREVQRFMPDFPHGKPSHVHHIAERRAQTSGSLCPKARWRLNVDLITQGDMCLLPSTRMTPLFSEQRVCGPESFNEVPIWLINKWHRFYIAVCPPCSAGNCRPGSGLGGTWVPGGPLPMAHVKCCQASGLCFFPLRVC